MIFGFTLVDFVLVILGLLLGELSLYLIKVDVTKIKFIIVTFIPPLAVFLFDTVFYSFNGYYLLPTFTKNFPNIFSKETALHIVELIVGSYIILIIRLINNNKN